MVKKYFLGANSGNGFFSLYDGFCTENGDFLHLIKAGPGCGKSSYMRRIAKAAEEQGLEVEYILCSGDPDSLDGIYIPELKCGYVDATAPHIIEPRHFAVNSDYVNLGQFCSRVTNDDIKLYTDRYKAYYKRAYSLLSAAAEIKNAPYPELVDNAILSQVDRRAQSAIRRSLGAAFGNGKISKCFTHAISCMGELVLSESIYVLCKRTFVLDNRYGLAKHYLNAIIRAAKERGDDIIVCLSPLMPDVPEAVIFPHQHVGFIAGDVYGEVQPCRHVRLDALIPVERLRACKTEIKNAEKIYGCIMNSVYFTLAEAKHWHDELEAVYRPYIDFATLDDFTENEIKKLFA